jgi:MinD-like ATPase involved in chromosome partitioning or flagellar assembly
LVLLVTTPEDVAVMNTYATIKRGVSAGEVADLRVLVNACHDTATAVAVQSRLAAACRRFLGRSIGRAPLLPRHVGALDAGNAPPLAWETLGSPFARSVNQLGRFAADVLAQQRSKGVGSFLRLSALQEGACNQSHKTPDSVPCELSTC